MTTVIALILSVPILYFLPSIPFAGKILTDLGVNHTGPVQVVFFAISYIFINKFLVKSYRRNLEYRKKNTGGSLDEASKLNLETDKLVLEYQEKLKKQNEASQVIYEKFKKEGQQEEERLLTQSRDQATKLVEQTKKKTSEELVKAREALKRQIPEISELMASRILGRDLR